MEITSGVINNVNICIRTAQEHEVSKWTETQLSLCRHVKHFVVTSMKDLFENVASQNIVDFIKETLFYKQL